LIYKMNRQEKKHFNYLQQMVNKINSVYIEIERFSEKKHMDSENRRFW